MKRAYVVCLLGAVVGTVFGVASCSEDTTTQPPAPARDSGVTDTSQPADGSTDTGGSDAPKTDSAGPKCPTAPKAGTLVELQDPASPKKVIPNDGIKLTGVVVTTPKILISQSSSGSCLWGVFVADKNETFQPYSGLLVTSYGDKEVDNRCPRGTDLIPEGIQPGDVVDTTGVYSPFAPASCMDLSPAKDPQLFQTCEFNKTGTTTPIKPANVTAEQLANKAADLPKYVNGLVRITNVTAATATMPGEPADARTFGDFTLQGSNLNVSDKIWYRGTGPTVAAGQVFSEIVGISYLDFCNWGISPRFCSEMVPASGGASICPTAGDAGTDGGSDADGDPDGSSDAASD